MSSENSPTNLLPRIAGPTVPSIWRRCVSVFAGSGSAENTELTAIHGDASIDAPVPDWKRPAMLGYFVIVIAFGVLGGWSALARLDSAVVASGTVTLETSKKIIQHFEGGIIAKILVHEGEHVEQGQILFMLDNTIPQANANATRNQLDGYLAQEARLVAERDGAQRVTYPPYLTENISRPVVENAIRDENKQFAERRATLEGEISIINSKIKQFETQIKGIGDVKASSEEQLRFINSELADLHQLLDRNLVQKSRVLAQERERARLEGVIGQAVADIAKTENEIGEAHLQMEQLHKKFSEDVNNQIVQVREKIAELREKSVVSEDVLHRIQVRAPRAGTIQNLRAATIGGVARQGEALAELVPDDDALVIDAEVSPSDVDAIESGMQAEVRFGAFHGYTLPLILGHVESVSHDHIMNEQSKQPYFLARVVVDRDEVPTMVKDRIKAGMPAEVTVPTGERTVLNYLVRPLRSRANSAFRER